MVLLGLGEVDTPAICVRQSLFEESDNEHTISADLIVAFEDESGALHHK